MKKLATLFALMAASIYGLKAQIAWPQNGTSIYYNGGNVGIGTTSPQATLQISTIRPILFSNNGGNGVYGSEIGFNAKLNTGAIPNQFRKLGGTDMQGGAAIVVDHWGSMYFQMYNANTANESIINYNPQIVFLNNGNVGIGTTTPGANLDIQSADNRNGIFIRRTGGNYSHNFFQDVNGYSNYYMYGTSNNAINVFATNGNSYINGGNVGIGTTNPSHKLDINTGSANVKTYHYGLETTVNTNGGWARALRFRNEYDNKTAAFGGLHGMAYIATGFDPNNDPTGYMSARLIIDYNGNVGIGTTNPQNKLDVLGTIRCTEVKVEAPWADFVFHPTYKLRTLGEVEQFIKTNSHLPEIPTAAEVKANGVSLGEMNAKLLQKVEELTLYVIEQNKKIQELEKQSQRIAEIENQIKSIINK